MKYKPGLLTAILIVTLCAFAQKPASAPSWIAASNNYANMLLAIQMKHTPEFGSQQGLSQFDTKASQPTLADEDQERRETEAVLEKFKAAAGQRQQEQVEQDLQIMIRKIQLNFKEQDFQRAHDVPFFDPSRAVFGGLQILLDAQTPADRRPAAVARLRAYAGLEPGYKPLAEILKQRVIEQMAKPGVDLSPACGNRDGIGQRLELSGWHCCSFTEVQTRRMAGTVQNSEISAHRTTTRGIAPTCCRRLEAIFVFRRRSTRWLCRDLAWTFRPARLPPWRIKLSPRFRRK